MPYLQLDDRLPSGAAKWYVFLAFFFKLPCPFCFFNNQLFHLNKVFVAKIHFDSLKKEKKKARGSLFL